MSKQFLFRWLEFFKKWDILFPMFIFLFFLFLLKESSNYPSESRAFPKLIILSTMFLSGSLLTIRIFSPFLKNTVILPESGGKEGYQRKWETRGRFYRGWMSIVFSLLAAFLFGFVFLIPASFISYTILLGRKEMLLKIIFLSLVTAGVVYLVFNSFLGVPMMHGFLWAK